MSDWIERTNQWGRQHPWRSALATAAVLVVVLTIFGVLVFDRGIGFAATAAAAYAAAFSLVMGMANVYLRKHDDD